MLCSSNWYIYKVFPKQEHREDLIVNCCNRPEPIVFVLVLYLLRVILIYLQPRYLTQNPFKIYKWSECLRFWAGLKWCTWVQLMLFSNSLCGRAHANFCKPKSLLTFLLNPVLTSAIESEGLIMCCSATNTNSKQSKKLQGREAFRAGNLKTTWACQLSASALYLACGDLGQRHLYNIAWLVTCFPMGVVETPEACPPAHTTPWISSQTRRPIRPLHGGVRPPPCKGWSLCNNKNNTYLHPFFTQAREWNVFPKEGTFAFRIYAQ